MKILAIESSGLTAGCAYLEDGVLKSEYYINNKLTHSRTLLPMIEEMSKLSGITFSELTAVAVSAGPGSFTGLRIGAATAKGLTLPFDIPIVKVSSLKGLAALIPSAGTLICPIMDARRGEVYCAAYMCSDDGEGNYGYVPLIEDSAMSIDDFLSMVENLMNDKGIGVSLFTGDGVPVHKALIKGRLCEKASFAPEGLSRQRAASIAVLGAQELEMGNVVSSDDFVPDYLRRPLAEKEKEEGILEDPGTHSLKKIQKGEFKRTRHPL